MRAPDGLMQAKNKSEDTLDKNVWIDGWIDGWMDGGRDI
jgi:hypothetical protein